MKVPFSWLKEYVDIDVTAQELEDKLFGCGFEVEELIDLSAEIDRVVVGVVKECTPVEGTHLCTCKVDCGEYGNDIQIVTGAPNVYAGMHTPAASTIPHFRAASGSRQNRCAASSPTVCSALVKSWA